MKLRFRRLARWMDAYTLMAFNPNAPYRRPTPRS